MIEGSKYCTHMMKKHSNKESMMFKEYDEGFQNSTEYWICGSVCVDDDVKVIDHYHITGKYRDFAHRECNMNVKLNHEVVILFHNIKNYDLHLIMQELDKFNFKVNVIPDGFKKMHEF